MHYSKHKSAGTHSGSGFVEIWSLHNEAFACKILRGPPQKKIKRSYSDSIAVVNFSRMVNTYQQGNPTNLRVVFHMEVPTYRFQLNHYRKSTTGRCYRNCDIEGIMTTFSLGTMQESISLRRPAH